MKKYSVLYSKIKYILIISSIIGLITHGFIIYNKLVYHDETYNTFSLGGTLVSGRWGLALFSKLYKIILLKVFSVSTLWGIFTIFIIAITAFVLVEIFNIDNRVIIFCITAIMIVFPVVSATFAYMFTSVCYSIALLCNVFGAYLILKTNKHWIGVLIITFGISIYQAYFPVTLTILTMYCIICFMSSDKNDFILQLKKAFFSYAMAISGMVLYLIVNKLVFKIFNLKVINYQNINGAMNVSITDILDGISNSYKSMISVISGDYSGIFQLPVLRMILLILFVVSIISLIVMIIKMQNKTSRKLVTLLVLIYPLCVNFINVMVCSGDTYIHDLMLYSIAFYYILPLVLIDKIGYKWIKNLIIILVCSSIVLFIYVDNEAYQKMYWIQKQGESFCNRLVERIESTEEYKQDMPVIFVGKMVYKEDKSTLTIMKQLDKIKLTGYTYNLNDYLNDYCFKKYLEMNCGFSPKYEFGTNENIKSQLKDMGRYPDYNSTKVINGKLYVKFH